MEQKAANDVIEIDMQKIVRILIRKLWIIFAAGAGTALAAFLFSKFILVPQYESTTKIYILNKQDDTSAITYADLQSGTQLTKDYMTLVTSRPVVEQVIRELGLDMTYEELLKKIEVSNPQDTRILHITAEYSDPLLAKQIADAIREAGAVHITEVMDIERVNIVEEGNLPEKASSPNVLLYTVIGGLAGVIITGIIIIGIHSMDDTIKTPEDIERYLGLSTLSSIPVQQETRRDRKKRKRKYKN